MRFRYSTSCSRVTSLLIVVDNIQPAHRYRTLSIHVDSMVEGKQKDAGNPKASDPTSAIRQIDVHRLTVDEVYTRFSTSPNIGLECTAVHRRSKDGRNVISSPPTQYWKKALNYVFGGFNFLMWIAFIVTIVSTYAPSVSPPLLSTTAPFST